MNHFLMLLKMPVSIFSLLFLLFESQSGQAQLKIEQKRCFYTINYSITLKDVSRFFGVNDVDIKFKGIQGRQLYFGNLPKGITLIIDYNENNKMPFVVDRNVYIATHYNTLKKYSDFLGITEQQLISQNPTLKFKDGMINKGDSISLNPTPPTTGKPDPGPPNTVVNVPPTANRPNADYKEVEIDNRSLYKRIEYKGRLYSVFEVNPTQFRFDLFNKSDDGRLYDFEHIDHSLRGKLVFAMNAGMFDEDYDPVGLFIKNSTMYTGLNLDQGSSGNFYLAPNGVFMIGEKNVPRILTTEEYRNAVDKRQLKGVQLATQSGPMLVIHGKIHPKFARGSTNLHLRNAVGISKNNNVFFVMSEDPVAFYEFAELFKLQLACDDALFLDGAICQIYIPQKVIRGNRRARLGTILSVSRL